MAPEQPPQLMATLNLYVWVMLEVVGCRCDLAMRCGGVVVVAMQGVIWSRGLVLLEGVGLFP